MLEQGVELHAVEGAPGAVQVLPGRGLLAGVVVVEEPAHNYTTLLHYSAYFTIISQLSRSDSQHTFSDVVLLVLTTFSL